MRYQIMGQEIVSDFCFRDLPPSNAGKAVIAVAEYEGPFPEAGRLLRESRGRGPRTPLIRVFEGSAGIQYCVGGVGRFWVEASGGYIWYRLECGARASDVESLLLGPLLALAFHFQGMTLLHASAIVVDSAAVAFSAPGGAGKSTLVASFLRAGYPLVTDDSLPVAVTAEGITTFPGSARLKLWADSLDGLGLTEDGRDPVVSWADKRLMRTGDSRVEQAGSALPLTALYFLDPHADTGRPITYTDLGPVAAALRVMGNMYVAEILQGAPAVRALESAAQIVSRIRVRCVAYARSYAVLPALRAALIADAQTGGPPQ